MEILQIKQNKKNLSAKKSDKKNSPPFAGCIKAICEYPPILEALFCASFTSANKITKRPAATALRSAETRNLQIFRHFFFSFKNNDKKNIQYSNFNLKNTKQNTNKYILLIFTIVASSHGEQNRRVERVAQSLSVARPP